MADPRRFDRPPAAGDVPERDRDARIEELLLAGLDYYFAGQHELAINVWTRVLFIDRGHARARAYIERARGAVAERQRQGDELLHGASAAFEQGDAAAARELVAGAIEHGASAEEALALLARIERFEKITHAPAAPAFRRSSGPARDTSAAPAASATKWRWIAGGVAAGVVLGALTLGVLVNRGLAPWTLGPPAPAVATPPFTPPLPVTTLAEVAVSRAEALYARGRLHDALDNLAAVPGSDPLRRRADELAATIQRQLLAGARATIAPPSMTAPRRP